MESGAAHRGWFWRALSQVERYAILLHVLDILLGLAGLSLSAAIVVVVHSLRKHLNYSYALLFTLFFLLFLLLAILVIRIGYAHRRNSRTLNAHVIEEHRKIFLHVGKYVSTQETEIHLRSLVPGVQYYWLQFKWTGSGPVTLTTSTKGVQLLGPVAKMATDLTHYIAIFEDPIPTRGHFLLKLEYKLEDKHMVARPYLGVWALHNRKSFELWVEFPTDPPNVYKIIQAYTPEQAVGDPVPYEFSHGSKVAHWPEKKPKSGRHYTLNWSAEYIKGLPDS